MLIFSRSSPCSAVGYLLKEIVLKAIRYGMAFTCLAHPRGGLLTTRLTSSFQPIMAPARSRVITNRFRRMKGSRNSFLQTILWPINEYRYYHACEVRGNRTLETISRLAKHSAVGVNSIKAGVHICFL